MTNEESPRGKNSAELRIRQQAAARRKQGEAIGQELRNQFQNLLEEPLPDHLLDLLNDLEKRESGS